MACPRGARVSALRHPGAALGWRAAASISLLQRVWWDGAARYLFGEGVISGNWLGTSAKNTSFPQHEIMSASS